MDKRNAVHMISKYYLVLSLFVICTIFSCRRSHQYPKKLLLADSLCMTESPDYAVSYLGKLKRDTVSMSTEDVWYYRLLCLKANDKAYIPNTDSIEVNRIVSYYKEHGDKSLLPVALYYAGCVYRDINSYKKSLSYFYETINLLENDIANPYYGLANSQIGQICLYHGLYDKAKTCFLYSLQTDLLNKKSKDIMFDYRDIADSYRSMCKYDSAMYFYDKAYNLAESNRDSIMKAVIDTQRAALFRRQKKYDDALCAIKNALNLSPRSNISAALTIAADIYMDINDTEKAVSCYKRLMQEGNVYAKYDACKNLSTFYRAKGDTKNSSYYLKYCGLLRDSIERVENVEDVAEILRDRSNVTIERKKNQQIFLSVALVLIITVGVTLYLKKRKHVPKQIGGDFYSSEIYNKIASFSSTDNNKISDKDWVELDSELNKCFPGFRSRLYSCAKMNAHRYRICMLIKCKISSMEISNILCCSKQAVTNMRSTLAKENYGKESKPSDWDAFIYSL